MTTPGEIARGEAVRRATTGGPRPSSADAGRGVRVLLWSLTLARVLLLPPFLLMARRAQALALEGVDAVGIRVALVGLLLLMGLTDMGDGWMARRHGLVTQVGAVVDAFADKLVQVAVAAYFALTTGPAFTRLPLWFFGLVVGRDILLGAGGLALRMRTGAVRVVHRPHGKASSVGVFLVFFTVLSGLGPSALPFVAWPVALLVLASTAAYVRDGVAQRPGRRG